MRQTCPLKQVVHQLKTNVTRLTICLRRRYRNQFMTDALSKELEYCQALVNPLLAALQSLTAQVTAAAAAGQLEALRLLLGSVRLVCRVFFSLNSPGLTEVRGSGLWNCREGLRRGGAVLHFFQPPHSWPTVSLHVCAL